jgi:hypothetical protein
MVADNIALRLYHLQKLFFPFVSSMDRHDEELRSLFGSSGPTDTLRSRVSSFVKEKRSELKGANINIQKLKQQQSSKQAEQRMTL